MANRLLGLPMYLVNLLLQINDPVYLWIINFKTMNIWAEKIEVIKRFEQVNDAFIIQAIKDLLDFTRSKTDQALETALYHTLKQSEQREVRSLEEIMPEIRKRFKG